MPQTSLNPASATKRLGECKAAVKAKCPYHGTYQNYIEAVRTQDPKTILDAMEQVEAAEKEKAQSRLTNPLSPATYTYIVTGLLSTNTNISSGQLEKIRNLKPGQGYKTTFKDKNGADYPLTIPGDGTASVMESNDPNANQTLIANFNSRFTTFAEAVRAPKTANDGLRPSQDVHNVFHNLLDINDDPFYYEDLGGSFQDRADTIAFLQNPTPNPANPRVFTVLTSLADIAYDTDEDDVNVGYSNADYNDAVAWLHDVRNARQV